MNKNGKGLVPGAHSVHGAYKWLRSGELPPGSDDLREEQQQYLAALVEKFGDEGLGVDTAAAIGVANDMFVVRRLLVRHVAKAGPLRESERDGHPVLELEPALKALAVFARTELQALKAAHEFAKTGNGKEKPMDLGAYLQDRSASAKNHNATSPASA